MRVRFSPSARCEFLDFIAYVRNDRPMAAVRFRERAEKALRRLETFPESGRKIPEFPHLPHREVIVRPLKLMTAASGQFVDPKEGHFSRLSIRELWAHFRILEPRFQSWVTEDADESPETLAVPWAEERWGDEVRCLRLGGETENEPLAAQVRDLEWRLQTVEERLDGLE